MSERYSVHLGTREEQLPPVVGGAATRGEAQRMAAGVLALAPGTPPHKAEVRERGVRLLDCYGRRGGQRVFHTYAAAQRGTAGAERPAGGFLMLATLGDLIADRRHWLEAADDSVDSVEYIHHVDALACLFRAYHRELRREVTEATVGYFALDHDGSWATTTTTTPRPGARPKRTCAPTRSQLPARCSTPQRHGVTLHAYPRPGCPDSQAPGFSR